MNRLTVLGLFLTCLVACGKSEEKKAEPAKKTEPAPKAKVTPDVVKTPEPVAFNMGQSVQSAIEGAGAGAEAAMSNISSTTEVCAKQSATTQPFCWQGVGAAYLADVSRDLAKFEETLSTLGSTTPIHCTGLGYVALQTISEDFKGLSAESQKLGDDCRALFWDGVGYSIAELQLGELTGPCRATPLNEEECAAVSKTAMAGVSVDKGCEGAENADSCAFGFGRGNTYLANGDWQRAESWCTGELRTACLAGVAFASVFYSSQAVDMTYTNIAALKDADKPRAMEGLALALAWRAKSNKSEFDKLWLAGANKAKSEALVAAATACNAVALNKEGCKWP